jgi:hypothetical protein
MAKSDQLTFEIHHQTRIANSTIMSKLKPLQNYAANVLLFTTLFINALMIGDYEEVEDSYVSLLHFLF